MPLNSRSQIVGGGAQLLAPVTVGYVPYVVDVGPPGALSDTPERRASDAGLVYLTIGAAAVREGIGATETLRLSQGFISQGSAVDSFIAGRGAAVTTDAVDSVAVGRGARIPNAGTGVGAVVIGATAQVLSDNNAIAIGFGAIARAAGAIVIGESASVAAGADGTVGQIVIGAGALATAGGSGPQIIVIGDGARVGTGGSQGNSLEGIGIGHGVDIRGQGDIAIGHGAQSTGISNFGSSNILIGHGAVNTPSASNNIIIGPSSVSAQDVVILGSASVQSTQTIVIGGRSWGVINTPNACFIGGPNMDITAFILGRGLTVASPAVRIVRFTNASGTNNAAGRAAIRAPLSTGNATPAPFDIEGGEAIGSGTTAQTVVQLARFVSGGAGIANWTTVRDTLRIIPVVTGQLRNPSNGASVIAWGADTLGFFNTAPVARPTVALGSSTDDLITALNNLGLIGI